MKLDELKIEKIDILKEMEVLNERTRKSVIENTSEEKIKAYDCGVKNTMNCLRSLITHELDGEKDRLIYQKYGEQCDLVRYEKPSEILKELGVEAVVD